MATDPLGSGQYRFLPALPLQYLSGSGYSSHFAVLINDFSPSDRDARGAGHFPACKHGKLCVREGILVADGSFHVRIPDDEVGVGSNGDGSFSGVQAEQLCGIRRGDRDELLEGNASFYNTLRVKQRQVVLEVSGAIPWILYVY